MAMTMSEYEFQALPEFEAEYEYEGEWEGEFEGEFEGEYESEQFISRLRQLWSNSPRVRQLATQAGNMALTQGLPAVGRAAGRAIGDRLGGYGRAGGALGAALGTGLGTYLGPQREFEAEYEWEGALNPIRRVYPDALMEHLGHAATEAESEAEAEAFIGALVPLAARLLPRAAPAVMRAAPGLIRGLSGVTRLLRRSPTTRSLVRAVPTIARRAAADIARQSAQGQPVPPPAAVRALARQTTQVLGNPQQAAQAYRRSRALDRRYHAQAAPCRTPGGQRR